MKAVVVRLPEELVEVLEKILVREEIDLFVSQAVLRQLAEFYAQLPVDQSPFHTDTQDDKNNHEWTS
jgi:hypothetical protein